MKEIFSDGDKKWSASRTPMLVFGVVLLVIWLAIGVGIAFFGLQWSQFSGFLAWGRDLFFSTIVGFIGGKAASRIKNGGGGGQDQ